MHYGALEKLCLLAEARDDKAKREVDELISNLKLRAKEDEEFIHNMESGC